MSTRFTISFDPWFASAARLALIKPASCYVDLDPSGLAVRMAWAFQMRIERHVIQALRAPSRKVASWGVHGFAGRWLVNGSTQGLLTLELAPEQAATLFGFPLRVCELTLSLDDPAGFATALDLPVETAPPG